VIAQFTLIGVLVWGASRGRPIPLSPGVATIAVVVGWLLIAAGTGLGIAGLVQLARNATPLPEPRDNATLVTTGLYRYARHPIYGGVVLIGIGSAIGAHTPVAIVVGLLLPVFFYAKSVFEERRLRRRFADYDAYARTTRRMIPWLW
jgi:protein-S-isoprenylcysteine O-methyltransferase Ste14